MALGEAAEQLAAPAAVAATAAAACATEAASDQWVQDTFRVSLDAEGNVVTHIPGLLACAVARLIEEAEAQDAAQHPAAAAEAAARHTSTRLHGCRPPGISIESYTQRLQRYCKCSPVCYVAAFAYMRRLHGGCGGIQGGAIRIDPLSAHRLMAVGAVIATKFYDDKYYSNGHYAQVAGVTLREWNAMELDMLFRLNFRARVDTAELCGTLQEMEALAFDHTGLPGMLPAGQRTHAGAAVCATVATLPTSAPSAAVAVAADEAGEEEEGGSYDSASTVGSASISDEEVHACIVSAAPTTPAAAPAAHLPWAAAEAVALAEAHAPGEAEEECSAPPSCCKKPCNAEAVHRPVGVQAA